MSEKRQYIIIILGLLFVAIGLAYSFVYVSEQEEAERARSVERAPVQAEFENKIVYDASQLKSVEIARSDCSLRGGEFDECGSPCAPEAEVCIEICALTCALPPTVEADSVQNEELEASRSE